MQHRTLRRIILGWVFLIIVVALIGKVSVAASNAGRTSTEHGTLAYQINDKTALAASVTFLNYRQIDGYDANGVTTGEITAYDWCGAYLLE